MKYWRVILVLFIFFVPAKFFNNLSKAFKMKITKGSMKNKENYQENGSNRTPIGFFSILSYGLVTFSIVVALGGIILKLSSISPKTCFFIASISIFMVITVKIGKKIKKIKSNYHEK